VNRRNFFAQIIAVVAERSCWGNSCSGRRACHKRRRGGLPALWRTHLIAAGTPKAFTSRRLASTGQRPLHFPRNLAPGFTHYLRWKARSEFSM